MPRQCHPTIYHDIQKYIHFSINIARNQFRLTADVYLKFAERNRAEWSKIWANEVSRICCVVRTLERVEAERRVTQSPT